MNRRLIAILLIVLGLGTIGAAIASATIWKPETTVSVPLPASPEENYVITDPGVLNIVNETVKVRAYAEDSDTPVFLAIGRTDEVQAWVAPSDHGKITGLDTWEELRYETVDAVVEPAPEEGEEAKEEQPLEPNPATSDMWLTQVNGLGEVTYTWQEIPGRWSLIAATDGEHAAPMIEFTWDREVPTPALIPGIIVGAVVALAGAALLVLGLLRRTEEEYAPAIVPAGEVADGVEHDSGDGLMPVEDIMAALEATSQDEEAELDALADAETEPEPEPVPPVDDVLPLTRREIRERERQREREAALLAGNDEPKQAWPSQEIPAVTGEVATTEPVEESQSAPSRNRLRASSPRRWFQRRPAPEPPAATGPIIIDEDTGEIIITGEIDLSSLAPEASADSWRAAWGLDTKTPTKWLPVVEKVEEGDDE